MFRIHCHVVIICLLRPSKLSNCYHIDYFHIWNYFFYCYILVLISTEAKQEIEQLKNRQEEMRSRTNSISSIGSTGTLKDSRINILKSKFQVGLCSPLSKSQVFSYMRIGDRCLLACCMGTDKIAYPSFVMSFLQAGFVQVLESP